MWQWTARAGLAAGASRWKKNARNNRGHRDSSGARHSRRSHHRTEVDPQDDREDRRGSSGDRHSGLGQHSRPSSVPNGFLFARQPQADRHQFYPLPRPAIPTYERHRKSDMTTKKTSKPTVKKPPRAQVADRWRKHHRGIEAGHRMDAGRE